MKLHAPEHFQAVCRTPLSTLGASFQEPVQKLLMFRTTLHQRITLHLADNVHLLAPLCSLLQDVSTERDHHCPRSPSCPAVHGMLHMTVQHMLLETFMCA